MDKKMIARKGKIKHKGPFLFLIFFFLLQASARAIDVKLTKQEVFFEIGIEKIRTVNFDSKDAVYDFIIDNLPQELKGWKNKNLNRSAIILLMHGLEEENIHLKNPVKTRDDRIMLVDESIKILKNELAALESGEMRKNEILGRRSIKSEIANLKKERHKLERWFFEKEEKIHSYVLHKKKNKWSTYLFGTRKFLIVLLGGQKDLAFTNMRAEGRDSVFKKSFISLDKRLISEGTYTVEGGKIETLPLFSKMFVCRFVELNPVYIRPPCAIHLTIDAAGNNKRSFEFSVREKNVIQFKIGLAASHLKEIRIIEDNQGSPNENYDYELKGNLFFMLDFHFARDMERFRPRFYKPWENFVKRFGVFAGLKLSVDPLEAVFLGVSFALSKDINLIGGVAFMDTVDSTKTEAKLLWGLSFSPSLVTRLLGVEL